MGMGGVDDDYQLMMMIIRVSKEGVIMTPHHFELQLLLESGGTLPPPPLSHLSTLVS